MTTTASPPSGPTAPELPFTTLDVFTSQKYTGNPLAIVSIPPTHTPPLTQQTKQRIAAEFNLSETVFLHEPPDPASPTRTIDIFTPTEELPFAGHPTVGTACLLLRQRGLLHVRTLVTKAGPIAIDPAPGAGGVRAAIPHAVHEHAGRLGKLAGPEVRARLGHGDADIRAAELVAPPVSIVRGMTFVLVRLDSLEQLAKVSTARVVELAGEVEGLLDAGEWAVGFLGRYYYFVETEGEAEGEREGRVALRTRMIKPGQEDAATGSAACTLASYLALERARAGVVTPLRFDIVQGVEMGRRSEITVEVVPEIDEQGEVAIKEVYLAGTAVVVMTGTLRP